MNDIKHVVKIIYAPGYRVAYAVHTVASPALGIDLALADQNAIGLQHGQVLPKESRFGTGYWPARFDARLYLGTIHPIDTSSRDQIKDYVLQMCRDVGSNFAVECRTGSWQPLRDDEKVYDPKARAVAARPDLNNGRKPRARQKGPTPAF